MLYFVSTGQVLALNGKPVKNLKSLANMVESCDDEFLKFDLEYQQVLSLSLYLSILFSTHRLTIFFCYSVFLRCR